MEKIRDHLADLALKNDITIIYAADGGSRGYGLASDNSDFDIRFIFVYNDKRKYLSFNPVKDTIQGFSEDKVYDWCGWDIRKALKHIHEMNPSITEWLYSPVVYYVNENYEFIDSARQLLVNLKTSEPLKYHYRSMAKKFKEIKENKINTKAYISIIRSTGMLDWLLKCGRNTSNKLVEIDFNQVLSDLKPFIQDECYQNVVNLIERKKCGQLTEEEPIKCVDEWIKNTINVKFSQYNCENVYSEDYDLLYQRILGTNLIFCK